MRIGKRRRSRGFRLTRLFLFFFILLLVGGGAYGYILFFEDEQPQISLQNPLKYMGEISDISFSVSDNNSGIRSIEAVIKQNNREHTLVSKSFDRMGFSDQMGPRNKQFTLSFDSKRSQFKDGQATIYIKVRDFSFRNFLKGNTTAFEHSVTIDTQPPKIHLLHGERYISPGGTGIVIYRLTGDVAHHGIFINNAFHPGFPIGDGRNDVFIAYFALPYDSTVIENSHIFAKDDAGNSTKVPFSSITKKVAQKFDRINVGDNFLSKKIPEFQQYYPEMSGNIINKYLFTNNEVRQRNNKTIAQICQSTQPKRLWHGSFLRMAGSQKAGFADHRTYYYKGKPIDKQVHLGMDIASTRRAKVKAANTGRVLFADYLGIYGHTVILDHGQGLVSLYSHLSQIQVAKDDLLEKAAVLGLTGTSGMAGGDHLHYSMLINGVFITPKEWWDPNWVKVNIEGPLIESKF